MPTARQLGDLTLTTRIALIRASSSSYARDNLNPGARARSSEEEMVPARLAVARARVVIS